MIPTSHEYVIDVWVGDVDAGIVGQWRITNGVSPAPMVTQVECEPVPTAAPTTTTGCDHAGDGWCVGGWHEVVPAAMTAAPLRPRAAEWETGPNVDNTAWHRAGCADWHGTLHDAKEKCAADPACATLHDFNGDGNRGRAFNVQDGLGDVHDSAVAFCWIL
eukprot:gene56722-biopygen56876